MRFSVLLGSLVVQLLRDGEAARIRRQLAFVEKDQHCTLYLIADRLIFSDEIQ